MPAVFALIGAIGAGTATVGMVAAAAVQAYSVYSVASGLGDARRAKKAAERSMAEQRAGQTVVARSSTVPRRLVYGRAMVSGPLALAESTGSANNFLHLGIPLCEGPIDAIEDVLLNDERAFPLDAGFMSTSERFSRTDTAHATATAVANGWGEWSVPLPHAPTQILSCTTGGSGGGESYEPPSSVGHSVNGNTVSGGGAGGGATITIQYTYTRVLGSMVQVRRFLGAADQAADQGIIDALPGKWSTSDRLQGLAWLYCRLQRDNAVFPTGLPNIKALVRGRKLYDPRQDSTVAGGWGSHRADQWWTWSWSENPALAILDYLRSPWGLDCDLDEVDLAAFIAAANICDETVLSAGNQWVARGTAEKRFTINGIVDTSVAPDEVLRQMLSTCQGMLTYTEGRFALRVSAWTTPVCTLTESDMAGYVTVAPRTPRSELFNAIRGTYVGAEHGYTPHDYAPYRSALYAGADGEEIWRDLELSFTRTASEAQRLTRLVIEQARRSGTVEVTCNLRQAFALQVGDIVAMTLSRFGFSNTPFRVVGWTWLFPHQVKLQLRAIDPSAYSWAYADAAETPAPKLSGLPNPWARSTMGTITLASGPSYAQRRSDGLMQQALRVSWPASTDPAVLQGGRVEIEHMRATDVDFVASAPESGAATSTSIVPVTPGHLMLVRARFVNSIGVPGNWSYAAIQIAGPASQIEWAAITGEGKPDAGATRNRIYRQADPPGDAAVGDLWCETDTLKLHQRTSDGWAVIANNYTDTSQLGDGAGLGLTAVWSSVTGSGRPADGATRNNIFRQGQAPWPAADGDLWFDVDDGYLYRRSGDVWQAIGNNLNDTAQLYDGAGLGNTAIWSLISGSGKPQDGATRNLYFNQAADPGAVGANALWYSDATGVLHRRNAANTGWEFYASYGADSNSLRIGPGANLLANTAAVSGTTGWKVQRRGGATLDPMWCAAASPITSKRDARPKPANAFYQESHWSWAPGTLDYTDYLYCEHVVPVVPGQRVELSAYVATSSCNGWVGCDFFDAGGNFVAAHASSIYAPTGTSGGAMGPTLAGYSRVYAFVHVPANAAGVRMYVFKNHWSGGEWASMNVALPYLGYAFPNQTQPSPWSEGAPRGALAQFDKAGTALLVDNAATIVGEQSIAGTSTILGAGQDGSWGVAASLTIANDDTAPRQVIVTGGCDYNIDANYAGPSRFRAQLRSTAGESFEVGEVDVPGSISAEGALSRSVTFTIPAGTTRTYQLYWYFDFGNTVNTLTVSRRTIRAEVIKR